MIWVQLVCPPTHEWTEKIWHIHSGILFSHKNNEVLSIAAKWLE
jgi:hypothetical protein